MFTSACVAGGVAFPILPAVGVRVGLSLQLIGAILAANRFGRIAASPILGVAADRIDGRTLLLGGMLVQAIVVSLYVLGVTSGHPAACFLVGRLLHTPGSACVFVSAQALALRAGGRAHGGRCAAMVRAAMAIGLPLGVAFGGALASRLGDAGTFRAALVALVLATVAAYAFVPRARARVERRPAWREIVAAVAHRRLMAVGALNFAVTFSALGMVLTTLVLVVGTRRMAIGSSDARATASALMGWMVIVMGLATLVTSRACRGRAAHLRMAALGTVMLPLAMLSIGLAHGIGGMFFGLTLLGACAGALSSALVALIGELVAPEHVGAGVGWLQLCGDLGGVAGPLLGATLLARGALVAYLTGALVLVAFVPVALWLLRRAGDRAPSAVASSSSRRTAIGSPNAENQFRQFRHSATFFEVGGCCSLPRRCGTP